MFYGPVSLAIIGAQFPNGRAVARRDEIGWCWRGEVMEFRRERAIVGGKPAIGVYSSRGLQIGYVRPDQAEQVAGQIAVARAIFQGADTFGAVVHATFDGSAPRLPAIEPRTRRARPPAEPRDEFCDIRITAG